MFDRNFIVLEFANILAGPITTMGFAELGARVIKLENPHTGGDAAGYANPSPPPHLHQHADEILQQLLNCDPGQIESLRIPEAFGKAT